MQSDLKVLFIHGGNGNSGEDQTKSPMAEYLSRSFHSLTVKMNTSMYDVCKNQQKQAIATFKPGISFGGALLFDLIRSREWSGLSLLMCPALIPGVDPLSLDKDLTSPMILCHGTADTVVPISVSQQIKAANPNHPHLSLIELPSASHSLPNLLLLVEPSEVTLSKMILDLWELRDHVHTLLVPPATDKGSTKERKTRKESKKCKIM